MFKVLLAFVVSLLAGNEALALTSHESASDSTDLIPGQRQEYCLRNTDEAFEAKCLKNEVIVMKRAIYGRMVIGRCLEAEGSQMLAANRHDPLFLGCSVDVVDLLDARCSGRNQCELQGTDRDLEAQRPCHVALKSYLEAEYECATVVEADRSCHVSVTSNPLHIMRSSTTKLSCGTKSQPWTLEAPAGQQINVSLLDFGRRAREPANQHHCQQYGYIIDKTANKNVSICGLAAVRNSIIYTSRAHTIEIILKTDEGEERDLQSTLEKFLIRFAATGCTNLIPPEDSWLRRNNNEAVVGCYSSHQSWHLRCVDNNWIGVIGNCTREQVGKSDVGSEPEAKQSTSESYQMMIMVTVAFAGVAICLLIICIGAVCWKRYYTQYQKYAANTAEKGRFGHVGYVQQQASPTVLPESC